MVSASATFSGPEYYNDCLGPVWFDSFAADLVQRLPEHPADNVLEIACGTGRVTIPIAQEGISVTGLDIVAGMIERARSKAVGLPARWLVGDARIFALGERFRLIFLTGNALDRKSVV